MDRTMDGRALKSDPQLDAGSGASAVGVHRPIRRRSTTAPV